MVEKHYLKFGSMSRIAKKPIIIDPDIKISFSDGLFSVSGSKGSLERKFPPAVNIDVTEKDIKISTKDDSKHSKAMSGTIASHIKNMISGVKNGYQKRLVINGVGYKCDVKDKTIDLIVGYAHPVTLSVPEGIKVSLDKKVIVVDGIDKEKVGQFSADIKAVKKVEPYKGHGIHYEGEYVRRKQGKRAVS